MDVGQRVRTHRNYRANGETHPSPGGRDAVADSHDRDGCDRGTVGDGDSRTEQGAANRDSGQRRPRPEQLRVPADRKVDQRFRSASDRLEERGLPVPGRAAALQYAALTRFHRRRTSHTSAPETDASITRACATSETTRPDDAGSPMLAKNSENVASRTPRPLIDTGTIWTSVAIGTTMAKSHGATRTWRARATAM